MLPAESALRCGLQLGEVSGWLYAWIAYRIEDMKHMAPHHIRPTSGVSKYTFACKFDRTGHTWMGKWVEPCNLNRKSILFHLKKVTSIY